MGRPPKNALKPNPAHGLPPLLQFPYLHFYLFIKKSMLVITLFLKKMICLKRPGYQIL